MLTKQLQLEKILEPTINGLHYQLWGIELLHNSSQLLLRVYIDSDASITIDDCTKVSHQISSLLDVEDPIKEEYLLEVSSPGLDCPLFALPHYQRHIGSQVRLTLRIPIEGRRNYCGIITGVDLKEKEIVIVVDDNEWIFPLEHIAKAKIIPVFTQ